MGAEARPDATSALPQRILRAFAARARRVGIRAVVMSDLASDLGVSKKTLYQHFESKSELVLALLRAWAEGARERAAERELRGLPVVQEMRRFAEAWVASVETFAPVFWQELARDYPEAHAIFRRELRAARRRTRQRIARLLRSDLAPALALELFQAVVARAADPDACARAGLARREALVAAVELWARGALRPEAFAPEPAADGPRAACFTALRGARSG